MNSVLLKLPGQYTRVLLVKNSKNVSIRKFPRYARRKVPHFVNILFPMGGMLVLLLDKHVQVRTTGASPNLAM